MYQKIKYIIIATMVLLILVVVITLDANTRYAAMQKEKKLKQREKARAAQEYYQKQQQEMQARRRQNSIAAGTQNFSQYPDSQQQNSEQYQPQNRNAAVNLNTYYEQLKQSQQPPEEPELAIVPFNRGYLVDEKTDERLDNYQLAKLFKLNDDTYAIITNIEQDDLNEGFAKQKIVVYKKVDESYQYAKYIFTKSLNQAEPEENATIDVKEQGDNLMIKYSGKGSITRVITKDSLRSSRTNTSSHPALGYVEYTTEYNLY